ncbi:MAG: ABC transporter substrate-binding protein [Candidatus Methylacidiphilales bacterium]
MSSLTPQSSASCPNPGSISLAGLSPEDAAIDLWYARCGGATASTVAIQYGWLQGEFTAPITGEAEPLSVSSVQQSPNREIRHSHFDHRLQAMFREGGNVPPIWARAAGQDTVVVGITWVDEYQAILTRPDSGIRTVADLKGRRLGLPLHEGSIIDFPRSMAVHGFVSALGLAGLTLKDAELIDIVAPAVDHRDRTEAERTQQRQGGGVFPLQALLSGKVDAIYTKGSFGLKDIAAHQLHQVVDLNSYADPVVRINNGTPRPITVGRDFLKARPDVVARYLAVLLRTGTWAETHPTEVRQAIARESHATEQEIVFAYGNDLHLRLTPKLSAEYIRGLEIQKDHLLEYGFLPNDFSVRDWIDYAPLEAARKLVENRPVLVYGEKEAEPQPA